MRALRSFLFVCLLVAACTGGPPTTPVGAQPVALDIRSQLVPLKLDQPRPQAAGQADLARRHLDDRQLAQFRRLVGPAGLARRQDPGLDLRRRQLAHGDGRVRRRGQPDRPEGRPHRLAARPRRQAAGRRRTGRCRGHGAAARRLVAGRLRAPSPHLALPDARRRSRRRSTCPRTSSRQPLEWRRRDHDRPARRPPDRDQRGVRGVTGPARPAGSASPPARTATPGRASATPRSPTSIRRRFARCPTAASCCWSAPSTWCAACASASCGSTPPTSARRHRHARARWPGSPRRSRSTIWKGLRPPRARAARRCCG